MAERHGLLVDAHCDEIDDEQSRFIEVLATRAGRSGMRERVTASHTTAMGSYNAAYSTGGHRIIARSGINMVCNPMVNLHLQGRFDGYPQRRGLTQVKQLLTFPASTWPSVTTTSSTRGTPSAPPTRSRSPTSARTPPS